MEKKYRVYVIRNGEGRHYIGLSEDVGQRLVDHNTGVSKWTKHRGPWHLVWTGEPMTLGEARKLENLLKAQKGGEGFYRLTGLMRAAGS
jgi:predicted GIY-YIG superfamily endonuclease